MNQLNVLARTVCKMAAGLAVTQEERKAVLLHPIASQDFMLKLQEHRIYNLQVIQEQPLTKDLSIDELTKIADQLALGEVVDDESRRAVLTHPIISEYLLGKILEQIILAKEEDN